MPGTQFVVPAVLGTSTLVEKASCHLPPSILVAEHSSGVELAGFGFLPTPKRIHDFWSYFKFLLEWRLEGAVWNVHKPYLRPNLTTRWTYHASYPQPTSPPTLPPPPPPPPTAPQLKPNQPAHNPAATATAHAGHTPPHLLNIDGTRTAYAASEASRGTATPVPSDYTHTAPQQEEGELRPRAISGLVPSHPGVGSARTGVSAASPATNLPKTKTSPFVRFASLRGGAGKKEGEGAPPSAFGGKGHARGGSLDSSPVSVSAPSALKSATQAPAPAQAQAQAQAQGDTTAKPPVRKPSLLRTLRGEAKVLAGRVRRDPGRVEKGRRMIDGEAAINLHRGFERHESGSKPLRLGFEVLRSRSKMRAIAVVLDGRFSGLHRGGSDVGVCEGNSKGGLRGVWMSTRMDRWIAEQEEKEKGNAKNTYYTAGAVEPPPPFRYLCHGLLYEGDRRGPRRLVFACVWREK
ncbi:hypothetical protein B0H11DRAFT_1899942 [Mycena galericulata]|nr:hypothetical protein B0H11DRAFT_1899942 [Mycena galericulata]